MEESDAGPAPTARVDSGAAGVHPAQAPAEVGAGRRSQPHAGPQIAAQLEAAQQGHALLQEAVAARGQRILVGRVQLGGGPAQAPGLPVAGLGFLPARAVGHGQQGGNGQHQPVAAHARGIQAARLVPLPADGFQTAEPLFDPVAAGIQGGLRLRHRRVGQQHPGLRLPVGVQHTPTGLPGTVQGLVPERPAGAHPQIARARDQRAHRHALALARGLKGDVGLVAQAGMPAQSHHLRPQVAAAQPLVTAPRHRHRSRHGRGQQAQPPADVVNPGPLCLRTHDVPGDRDGVLAIDHTDHQRHQVILFAGALVW